MSRGRTLLNFPSWLKRATLVMGAFGGRRTRRPGRGFFRLSRRPGQRL